MDNGNFFPEADTHQDAAWFLMDAMKILGVDAVGTSPSELRFGYAFLKSNIKQSNSGTEYDPFLQAGLDVRKDGNDGLMHHKVFIVDETIVVLGSYNFSKAAEERNDENIIIVNNEKIAEFFMQEFERVYANAHE